MESDGGSAAHAGLTSVGQGPKRPPLTLEEAERHGRLCTVRQIQQPLEQLCQDAKSNGRSVEQELHSRGMADTKDFIECCPTFPLTCNPIEFSELGSGFPLYFQFLKFLIAMTLAFILIQIPVMVENIGHSHMHLWHRLLTKDEKKLCTTCVSNQGVEGLGDLSADLPDQRVKGYGESCFEHDLKFCNAFSQNYSTVEWGAWCCRSWCYVDEGCPIARGSSLKAGLFYSYEACKDDTDIMSACAWNTTSDFTGVELSVLPGVLVAKGWPYFGSVTPGNAGPHGMTTTLSIWLHFVAVLVFLMALTFLKAWILQTESIVDKKTTQPNDFAILVQGLPQSATDEAPIADFFRKNAVKGKEVEVAKVVICWDLREFSELHEQMKKEKKTLQQLIVREGFNQDHPQVQKVISNLNRLRALIHSVGPDVASRISSTGLAIVIFREQADHRRCLERWTGFWPSWMYHEKHPRWGVWWSGGPLPRFPNAAGSEIWRLTVTRAANPSDINWLDLGRTLKERMKGLALNWMFMIVMVGAAVGLVYLLQRWQESLKKKVTDADGKEMMSVEGGISAVPAVLVSIINMCLVLSSKKLSKREYHLTITSEQASTTAKMTMALVMNTSLVLWILNMSAKNWYIEGGLIEDVFWMLLINVCAPLVTQAMDIPTKGKRLVRCIRRYDKKIANVPRAQGEQMLKFWEPSAFNSPRRYTTALQTFIACSLFQPLMPQILIFSLIGIILQYCMDKYMLLRYHKRPDIPEGSTQVRVALQIVRVFISFGLPVASFVFLRPSIRDETHLIYPLAFGLLIAASMALMPDAVQRTLLCTCICLRRARFRIDDDASAIDYYSAQHFWTANMRYHKTHPLYKELPPKINPEILSPSSGALSTADIRGNYAQATDAMASDESTVVKPILLPAGVNRLAGMPGRTSAPTALVAPQVAQTWIDAPPTRQDSFDSSTAVTAPVHNFDGAHAMSAQVIPGCIGTPTLPTWEFETKAGWQRFDNDCHSFVEERYQDFKQGRGGPTRRVRTCGKEVFLNFEDMTQSVEGSHKRRNIRRLT